MSARKQNPPQSPFTKGGGKKKTPVPPVTKGGGKKKAPIPPFDKGGQGGISKAKEAPPSPPINKRPNRAHGAIDRLPNEVQLQIKDWYLGRPEEGIRRLTFEEMSLGLADLGYSISRNQVWRWIGRQRRELDRLENARIRAEAVVQAAPPGTTIEDGTRKLVESLIMEAFLDAEPMQAQSITDLGKLTLAYARLAKSAVVREQWEHKKGKQIEEAVTKLKTELQKELDGQPELTARLLDMIEAAKGDMLEKIA